MCHPYDFRAILPIDDVLHQCQRGGGKKWSDGRCHPSYPEFFFAIHGAMHYALEHPDKVLLTANGKTSDMGMKRVMKCSSPVVRDGIKSGALTKANRNFFKQIVGVIAGTMATDNWDLPSTVPKHLQGLTLRLIDQKIGSLVQGIDEWISHPGFRKVTSAAAKNKVERLGPAFGWTVADFKPAPGDYPSNFKSICTVSSEYPCMDIYVWIYEFNLHVWISS